MKPIEPHSQPKPHRGIAKVVPMVITDIEQHGDIRGESHALTDAIMLDITRRSEHGVRTYGSALMTFNGRSAILDAYEEQLDATNYLKQACMEWPTSGRLRLLYWNAISLVFALASEVHKS